MSNMNQIEGNGFSCFSGPEMMTEEGLMEITGQTSEELMHHLHFNEGRPAAPDKGTVKFVVLKIPVCVSVCPSVLAEAGLKCVTLDTLSDFAQRLKEAKENKSVGLHLPAGFTPECLVGSVYVESVENPSHMDLIGCLHVPELPHEFPLSITRTVQPPERGNFFLPGNRREQPPYLLREYSQTEVKPSWLARFGEGKTVDDLRTVTLNSSKTSVLVIPTSPVLKFIDLQLMAAARSKTGFKNQRESSKKLYEAYSRELNDQRKVHFGFPGAPYTQKHRDIQVPVETYNTALDAIAENDMSNLTLMVFLKRAKLTLCRAHKSDFEQNGDPELVSTMEHAHRYFTRASAVKFTICIKIGRVAKK